MGVNCRLRQSRFFWAIDQLVYADPESYVTAEYARQMALRCGQHLQAISNQTDFNASRTQQIERLQNARKVLDEAIAVLGDDTHQEMKHFGESHYEIPNFYWHQQR